MNNRILTIALAMGIFSGPPSAHAQFDQILKKAEDAAKSANTGDQGLSNDKIVAGLKQALSVCQLTGRFKGFSII